MKAPINKPRPDPILIPKHIHIGMLSVNNPIMTPSDVPIYIPIDIPSHIYVFILSLFFNKYI